MASYVISDLHGERDRFHRLLELIGFSDSDELYIIGDVIDRGPEPVELLGDIMSNAHMHMILGNHEYMCLQYFSGEADEKIRRRWNRNGNYTTLMGLDKLTDGERERVLAYLRSLPDQAELSVGGIRYILVHGYLGDTTHERVWSRPKADERPAVGQDTRIVIGHTPVCEYVCPGSDESIYVHSHTLTQRGEHFRILHAEAFTDIDCCCGYGMSAARLASLRLDDGAEFYA